MTKETIAENTLKVWYIPQVGAVNKPYEVIVPNIATAKIVMDSLTGLSNYEFENEIKPDYADAIGLSRYEDDGTGNLEWIDWEVEELEFELNIIKQPDLDSKLAIALDYIQYIAMSSEENGESARKTLEKLGEEYKPVSF